jgi:selenocysteine-specific elongation factor
VRHYVIGTAGHIDHGKSALVKALTGTDPDRLVEEQRRGMTIDLGFAHFDLPDGRRVGIVDVPGHERLIRNMLAGATGIDLVLFVVAADEGIMPQTREHLDILRFLPVHSGIVVLNKIDLTPDPAWLALVREDLASLTRGSILEHAPIVEVSARTGQGVDALKTSIQRALHDVPSRVVDAAVRLPIDRAFTMAGFGTVVTGTLWTGRIAAGMTLELLPRDRSVRVRGVQSHGAQRDQAEAGARVAVNLAGIEKDELDRGDVLATPGVFVPTTRLNVRTRLLPDAPRLPHGARVRMYLGASEVIGRVALAGRAGLEPGQEAAAQLRLDRPLVADAGDPFVLRRFSPMATIGGGVVLDAHPPVRRRVPALETAANTKTGDRPEESGSLVRDLTTRVAAGARAAGSAGAGIEELMRAATATRPHVEEAVRALVASGDLMEIRGRVFHEETIEGVAGTVRAVVAAYHGAHPWRAGIPKDELKRRAFPSGDDRGYALTLERLARSGEVDDLGALVRARGFMPTVSARDAAVRARIAAALRDGRFAPPSREELARGSEPKEFDQAWRALLDEGLIVDAGQGVYFHRDAVEQMKQTVADEIRDRGSLTVASFRTRLGTSRKYALSALEYFDTIRFTRRQGDARVILDPQAAGPRPRPV